MFENLDDPAPPEPNEAALRAVRARARARRRSRRRLAAGGVAALVLTVAVGVPAALSWIPSGVVGGAVAQETAYAFNLREGPLAPGTSVPTTALVDVVFVGPYHGFALAAHRGSMVLAATADGGSTWKVVDGTLPLAATGVLQAGGAQVEFTDSLHGYLWQPGAAATGGSVLWVTDDGGTRWTRAPIGSKVADVSAIGTDVWALVWLPSQGARGAGSGLAAVALQVSTDGGLRWHPSPAPSVPPALPAATGGAGSGPGAVELARITPSWAFVLQVGGSARGAPAGTLWFTSDGGATWAPRAFPCTAPYGAGAELAASSGADLWLFCGSQANAGYQAKALYRSADGGTTWTLAAATPYPAGAGRSPGGSSGGAGSPGAGSSAPVLAVGYIAPLDPGHDNLAVLTPKDAWLMPARGSVLVTTDGGSRWSQVPALSSAGFGAGAVGNVTFLSPTLGWACEYGVGLFRTSNGVTWTALGT